jgi:hypothetical protein
LNYLRQSLFGLVVVGGLCAIMMIVLIRSHIDTINGGRVPWVDPSAFASAPGPLVIDNVRVLSADGRAFLQDRSVVIVDGSIISVGPMAAGPPGARRVDARGGFLIPGLIDGQIDLRRQPNDLLIYLAHGVTHIRDLAGHAEDLDLARRLAAGQVGPSMTVASPKLFSAGLIEGGWISMTRPALNVRHPERAGELVEELAEIGYAAISLDAGLDLPSFMAINTAAKAAGIPTVGRLPDGFDLSRLSGMALSELIGVEDLVEGLLTEFSREHQDGDSRAFLEYVQERSTQLAEDLRAADTAINSSLWFADTLSRQAGDLVDTLKSLPLEYANPGMVEGSPYAGVGWLPGMNRFELPRDLDEQRRARTIAVWEMRSEAQAILVRELAARGVPVTAGSKATAELMIPGLSLHEELAVLNRSGLSPAESLLAATRVPAERMGLSSGVIEPGRPADLVLLRDDPLADIRNSRSIEMVIRGGRLFDRNTLDSMLAAVRRAHAESREFDLSRYR